MAITRRRYLSELKTDQGGLALSRTGKKKEKNPLNSPEIRTLQGPGEGGKIASKDQTYLSYGHELDRGGLSLPMEGEGKTVCKKGKLCEKLGGRKKYNKKTSFRYVRGTSSKLGGGCDSENVA